MQVRRSDGAYIDVPYRPDSVLINLGVQMEHWTNKIYPATVLLFTLYCIKFIYFYARELMMKHKCDTTSSACITHA